MEPHQSQLTSASSRPEEDAPEATPLFASGELAPQTPPARGTLSWIFLGPEGLRSGWSIALFLPVSVICSGIFGALLMLLHLMPAAGSRGPRAALLTEIILLAGAAGAAELAALLEQRPKNLLEYSLTGPRRGLHFSVGAGAGFVALAALVGAQKAGGWLSIAPAGTSTGEILVNGLLWALAFLMVGLFEEGTFRGYLQSTLTRGINLWWALGIEAAICAWLMARGKGNGIWGVYAMMLLGLVPCLWLARRKAPSRGFWLAAWVASTLFALVHTGNNGETWIGILAAGAIGFVFAVSVRLTGSLWWAVGFHAAWDWAETFFFGTADSGMPAVGSWLVARPTGNPLWSGGANGPEGSLLVLAAILATLVGLMAVYGRKSTAKKTKF